jgi:hypothetical protein
MNSTAQKNGQAAKTEVPQMKETSKGQETSKELMKVKTVPDPIAERLKNIHAVHTLSLKRATLIETQDNLRFFETELGESDRIMLINHGGSKVEVKRPEAVVKVLTLLKGEVENAISDNNRDLLNAAL